VEDGFTYPLFDDLTGDLLRRLPTVEEATLAKILDGRRGLEGPLRGVRVVVAGFSGEVSSAAWEPGLAEEANALFREKVESAVERIEHPYGRSARSRNSAGGSCAGSRDLYGTRQCMASVSHWSHAWMDSPPTSLALSCRTSRQRGTAWWAFTGPRPSPGPATSRPPVVAGGRYSVANVESNLRLVQNPRPCSSKGCPAHLSASLPPACLKRPCASSDSRVESDHEPIPPVGRRGEGGASRCPCSWTTAGTSKG
jgi:hypothetical protein